MNWPNIQHACSLTPKPLLPPSHHHHHSRTPPQLPPSPSLPSRMSSFGSMSWRLPHLSPQCWLSLILAFHLISPCSDTEQTCRGSGRGTDVTTSRRPAGKHCPPRLQKPVCRDKKARQHPVLPRLKQVRYLSPSPFFSFSFSTYGTHPQVPR